MDSTASTKKLAVNFIATTLKIICVYFPLANFKHFLCIDFQLFNIMCLDIAFFVLIFILVH